MHGYVPTKTKKVLENLAIDIRSLPSAAKKPSYVNCCSCNLLWSRAETHLPACLMRDGSEVESAAITATAN